MCVSLKVEHTTDQTGYCTGIGGLLSAYTQYTPAHTHIHTTNTCTNLTHTHKHTHTHIHTTNTCINLTHTHTHTHTHTNTHNTNLQYTSIHTGMRKRSLLYITMKPLQFTTQWSLIYVNLGCFRLQSDS